MGNNGRTGLRSLDQVDAGKDRSALMTCHNQKRVSEVAVLVLVCFALLSQTALEGGPEKETPTTVQRDQQWDLKHYGHMPPKEGFRCRAFWTGGIFTANHGPWDRGLQLSDEPEVEWRRTIDWCAKVGVENVIAGAAWANMRELLLFERHPEAATVPREQVRRNRAHVNAILAYAKQRGVGVLFHSYNYHAPQTFLDAHPAIRTKQDRYIGVTFKKAGYADNLCWQDPLYRTFLIDCWEELFDVCPDLGGLLLTVGEANKCDHCLPDIDRVSADFLRAFQSVTKRHKRQGWVRTWHFREFPTQHPTVWPGPVLKIHHHPERYVPDDLVYVMKYSHTDCVDVGPDPGEVEAWKAAGKKVLLHVSAFGENTGSHRWASPRFQSRIAQRARESGADGIVIGSQNTGTENCGDAPFWMNHLALVYYAACPRSYDATMWREYLSMLFPGTGGDTLSIFDRWAKAATAIPRVYGQALEGLIHGKYSDARIGTAEWDPPYWWQEDLLGAYEFVQHVEANGYDPAEINRIANGRTLFDDYLVERSKEIDTALQDLDHLQETCKDSSTRDALSSIRDKLDFWTDELFQTAWIFRNKRLTLAIENARDPAVRSELQEQRKQWVQVLARRILFEHEDADAVTEACLQRLDRRVSGSKSATWTSWLTGLRADREILVKGYLTMPDGAMKLSAVWMDLAGEGTDAPYCRDGEFIKIGAPGPSQVKAATRAVARWSFPGEAGPYEIVVRYKDDKDDAGTGAGSRLLVDGVVVHEWGYDIDDDQVHETRCLADFRPGSEVCIESVTEPNVATSAEFCRIESLVFRRVR